MRVLIVAKTRMAAAPHWGAVYERSELRLMPNPAKQLDGFNLEYLSVTYTRCQIMNFPQTLRLAY